MEFLVLVVMRRIWLECLLGISVGSMGKIVR